MFSVCSEASEGTAVRSDGQTDEGETKETAEGSSDETFFHQKHEKKLFDFLIISTQK